MTYHAANRTRAKAKSCCDEPVMSSARNMLSAMIHSHIFEPAPDHLTLNMTKALDPKHVSLIYIYVCVCVCVCVYINNRNG